ncbi:MAG: bifunctional hydroxymethylpyrimidine kinase/phosphomethylpyrimidine kinase [Pseudomonadota bacterium]
MQIQTSAPLILGFGLLDPVGAVGLQADCATYAAHGCHGLSVCTGLLIADSARVEDMQEIDADWLVDQARVLLEDMPVAAFKVGAIANLEQMSAIAEIVSDYPEVPLILDPFLSCLPDSGMGDEDMLIAIRQILVPQTTLLLLSQVELARMAETWREGASEGMLEADVAELTGMGCEFVLVTGTASTNAGDGAARANTLYDANGVVASIAWQHQAGPFLGAGNTLSAALAALMATGVEAAQAVQLAQDYTTGALARAQRMGMGKLVPDRFFQGVAARASVA